MTKYLPSFGWKPHVISGDWSNSPYASGEMIDDRLQESIIGRTIPSRVDFQGPSFKNQIRNFLDGKRVPKEWSKGAIEIAEDFLQSNKVDAILATYPIISTFYVADYLSTKHGIPWVADLRDIAGEHPPANFMQKVTISRHIAWEKSLLNSASEISTISPGNFLKTLEIRTGKKVHYIPNGFDPEIFFPARELYNRSFTIVYTGALGRTTDLSLMGKSLNQLFETDQISPEKVKIKFFGTDESDVRRFFNYPKVWQIIEIIPWSAQSRIAKEQREADLLLHATFKDLKGIMTGKIFEYLAAERPILTSPGDNDVVDNLLDSTRAGIIGSDLDSTKKYVLKYYREWVKNGTVTFQGDAEKIAEYSYKNLTGKIADLLNATKIKRKL